VSAHNGSSAWSSRTASPWRWVTEVALSGYLLTVPLGRGVPEWLREVLLLGLFGGMAVSRWPGSGHRAAPEPFGLLLPLVLFALSTLVSTVLSVTPLESMTRITYLPIALVVFFATQDVLSDPPAHLRLRLVLAAIILGLGLDGLYQFWTGRSLLGETPLAEGARYRISASLPSPTDLALIPIFLPVALSAVARLRRGWAAVVLLAGLPPVLATTILSGTRTAWLALLVGLGTLGVLGRQRRIAAAVLVVAVVLALVAYGLGVGAVRERAAKLLDVSRDARIGQWLVAWQMFKESPLLGKGVEAYGELYLPYLRKVSLPTGYAPEVAPILWPHNIYLELLAERGLLGALAFGTLVTAMGVRLRRGLAPDAPAETRTLAAGFAASLACFLTVGVFDLSFQKDWALLAFFVLAALIARLPSGGVS